MSTNRRRKEIDCIYDEGRTAAFFGEHRQSNPYAPRRDMDAYHWYKGFDAGVEEMRNIDNELELQKELQKNH